MSVEPSVHRNQLIHFTAESLPDFPVNTTRSPFNFTTHWGASLMEPRFTQVRLIFMPYPFQSSYLNSGVYCCVAAVHSVAFSYRDYGGRGGVNREKGQVNNT